MKGPHPRSEAKASFLPERGIVDPSTGNPTYCSGDSLAKMPKSLIRETPISRPPVGSGCLQRVFSYERRPASFFPAERSPVLNYRAVRIRIAIRGDASENGYGNACYRSTGSTPVAFSTRGPSSVVRALPTYPGSGAVLCVT